MPIDRTEAARALALAISYKHAGRDQEAYRAALALVQMLVDAAILEDGFANLEQYEAR
jgi:hypothetical protein